MNNLAKIILFQAKKGGVGKSWLCLQIAAARAKLYGLRILIITSDNQNNIPQFAGVEINSLKGIEHWLKFNEGDTFELRDNLYYIPLNSAVFPAELKSKLKVFIEALKNKFDFILIDGTPIIDVNTEFSEIADHIVIPTFLDEVTSYSIKQMLDKYGVNKVKAIIPNRAAPKSSVEKKYYNNLQDSLNGSKILLTCPLKQSAVIANLIDKGKTVYDSESSKLIPIKTELEKVIEVIR